MAQTINYTVTGIQKNNVFTGLAPTDVVGNPIITPETYNVTLQVDGLNMNGASTIVRTIGSDKKALYGIDAVGTIVFNDPA